VTPFKNIKTLTDLKKQPLNNILDLFDFMHTYQIKKKPLLRSVTFLLWDLNHVLWCNS